METLSVVQFILSGVIIATAVYYFADARSKARWINDLQSELARQREEMREWQNKALVRHGSTPIGQQPARPAQTGKQEITPKVVTRQQLEYRNEDTEQPAQPVTIHAHDVSYSRVARSVEKAAEIIAAHK